MPAARDRSLLVQVATLYYLQDKSQAEIAGLTGLSRSNISRILTAAREQGVVEIRINDAFDRESDLESALIARFGLIDARVAPGNDHGDPLARVGGLGAEWLLENLPAHGSVALSWGASVQSVVTAVPTTAPHPLVDVVPLVGGLSVVDSTSDGNILVRALALKIGASHRRLYAPAIVESRSARDALLREPAISGVLDVARRADVALVGVGSVGHTKSRALIDSMRLDAGERRRFERSGAVGDCCTRYFDRAGRDVGSPTADHVIGVELEDLRRVPLVAGVAVGADKVAGVHGALSGGLLKAIITDSSLARALLEFDAR